MRLPLCNLPFQPLVCGKKVLWSYCTGPFFLKESKWRPVSVSCFDWWVAFSPNTHKTSALLWLCRLTMRNTIQSHCRAIWLLFQVSVCVWGETQRAGRCKDWNMLHAVTHTWAPLRVCASDLQSSGICIGKNHAGIVIAVVLPVLYNVDPFCRPLWNSIGAGVPTDLSSSPQRSCVSLKAAPVCLALFHFWEVV